MIYLLTLCSLVAIMAGHVIRAQSDPCVTFEAFPNTTRRGATNQLSAGDTEIDDRDDLTDGWYGNVRYLLLDTAPGFLKCGTWFPVWRRSHNRSVAEMCVQSTSDDCQRQFYINMKDCDGYEVYLLKRPPIYRAGFCVAPNPEGSVYNQFDQCVSLVKRPSEQCFSY